jgi:uncharacterized protein (TIGR03084 family)
MMSSVLIPTFDEILRDLEDEHRSLAQVLETLGDDHWRWETASPGWQIRHQISHLEFFDRRAVLALSEPDEFVEDRRRLMSAAPEDLSIVLAQTALPRELLTSWILNARQLVEVGRQADPTARVPWYGPSMSVKSFLTARLMECWAHGEDIAAAVSFNRKPTDRLRHIAHIGVATRAFCLAINDLPEDNSLITIQLHSPDGGQWLWTSGTSESRGEDQSVTGDALDFCRVVTQRQSIGESSLMVKGTAAQSWMDVAQAFAGPPGRGRKS